ATQFAALVRSYDAGDGVTLLLFRDGEEVEVDVKLAAAMVPPLEMYGATIMPSVQWPDLRERRQMVPQLRAIELPPAPPVIDRIPGLFPGDDRDGFKGNISRSVIRDDRGSATLVETDEESTLVVRDDEGNVIFEGPLPAEDERDDLLGIVRERINQLTGSNLPVHDAEDETSV
ncbi:MAG: hypothetical protein AAGI46_15990, partial [Planctomycetota bacterium]